MTKRMLSVLHQDIAPPPFTVLVINIIQCSSHAFASERISVMKLTRARSRAEQLRSQC